MSVLSRVNRLLSGIEWRWSLGTLVSSKLIPTTSFALPAWATWASRMFSDYAPLSWVIAGFSGLLVYAACVAMHGFGRHRTVRSRYDEKFLSGTGGVDPLSKVFEGKRIFLNDFILPSNPLVNGKTFVDCEIVGPANIYLDHDNNINEIQAGKVDAVALSGKNQFINGFVFTSCTFRKCTFHRITLFFHPEEARLIAGLDLNWLNWIVELPAQDNLQIAQNPQDKSERTHSDPSPV